MPVTTVPVSGLTCARCVETVTEQITGIDGVEQVEIDLVEGGVSTVTITAAGELPDNEIQTALRGGGAFDVAR